MLVLSGCGWRICLPPPEPDSECLYIMFMRCYTADIPRAECAVWMEKLSLSFLSYRLRVLLSFMSGILRASSSTRTFYSSRASSSHQRIFLRQVTEGTSLRILTAGGASLNFVPRRQKSDSIVNMSRCQLRSIFYAFTRAFSSSPPPHCTINVTSCNMPQKVRTGKK